MKLILTFVIFLFLITEFLHPISALTQDLGRHLLVGKIVLQTHTVPKTNLFSYTYPDFPFINHHWLSEVVFYAIQQIFGFNGLLIISTFIIVYAFAIVFFYSLSRHSGTPRGIFDLSRIRFWSRTAPHNDNIFAIAITSLLYIRILADRTDVRPEVCSFLFLSLFITILYKNRERFTKWIFVLPFLELVWVNIHIYFPIGIAVIGLFVVDNVFTRFWSRRTTPPQNDVILATPSAARGRPESLSKLLLILLLCIFVTLFNPNGIAGTMYPLHVFNNYGYQIEENQNLFFLWNYFGGKTTILYFLIASTLLLFSLILTVKKTRPIDWLLAIFFTGLAINSERNLPLFVFATFIPFTYSLTLLFKKISSLRIVEKTMKQFNNITIILSILLALLFLWQIKEVTTLHPVGLGVESGAQFGADFFIKNSIQGPIFNNFDIGSYLEYRLYPQARVFVDGRPEAYPTSFFQNTYIPMQINPVIFETQEKKYNLNVIFFSHTDQTPWAKTFLPAIIANPKWTIVYLDDYVVILVKNTEANASLIKKYGMPINALKITNVDTTNKMSYLRLAQFFRVIGSVQKEEQIYVALLKADPTNCIALGNLANMLSQKNNPTAYAYLQQFQQSCQ